MQELISQFVGAPHWWWVGAAATLFLVEITTMSLFLLWPGLAALAVAAIVYVAPDASVALQLGLFALIALVLTVAGRPWAEATRANATDRPHLNQRARQLIGRRVSAEQDFAALGGSVRLDDSLWAARLEAGSARAGDVLVVRAVEGSTLIVSAETDAEPR